MILQPDEATLCARVSEKLTDPFHLSAGNLFKTNNAKRLRSGAFVVWRDIIGLPVWFEYHTSLSAFRLAYGITL